MFNVLENNTDLQDLGFSNKFSSAGKIKGARCEYRCSVIPMNYVPNNQSGNTAFNAVVNNNIVSLKGVFFF